MNLILAYQIRDVKNELMERASDSESESFPNIVSAVYYVAVKMQFHLCNF